ncbi:malate synthase [Ascoidea rubescens DSM 1968]|uniref:Malate synthase n=1 Tax=Ascoidea rubescens DSM 1968 TaxID=1344418 RepID=A0A1D2VL26_9ASCO|nr:malate synthase [Ascoidea rubescens DSM 1968]ODV62302.1 malate synthase [Ascoidea rubescens DSM 1968]
MTFPPKVEDVLRGVEVKAAVSKEGKKVLNVETQVFLSCLHRNFNERRLELLKQRDEFVKRIDEGEVLPNFLAETKYIREDRNWRGPSLGKGLEERKVEITGPVHEKKMVINGLNSKVSAYMADFEDSLSPTWNNLMNGQVNLYEAVRKSIEIKGEEGGNKKQYKLNNKEELPTLIVRPRGLHLDEKHVLVDGKAMSGSIFDFGVYFFNNGKETIKQESGPYFYLPKLEHHLEAKLWNDIFNYSQDYIGMKRGSIRATVLIETLPAVFQMDEIIYQLREHSSGLNCGRWDYLFSYMKTFKNDKRFVLPNRSLVNMSVGFMRSYVELLIDTCHKRGVHAMGGMAALIPIKNDKEMNAKAMKSIKEDKLREVLAGHDGTWIAHPGIAPIAYEVFNKYIPGPNQMQHEKKKKREISNFDLLSPFIDEGIISEEGIRLNIRAGIIYSENWLKGVGCVAINYLMEDAATAEVSRLQLHQWVKFNVKTDENKRVDKEYVARLFEEESRKLIESNRANEEVINKAAQYFKEGCVGEKFHKFLTTMLYDEITTVGRSFSESKL